MVLRSGAKLGPAGGWDRAGAAAGVAVVLVLILFVVAAGTRDGYSHIDDTISQLGARGTPGAWWFTVVNVAGALLIIVFAYGVHRRLPVGLATGAFLGAVAFGALMIGGFRCSGECRPGVEDAHGVAASFTAAMITGFLVAAAWALRHSAVHWFRNITLACTIANIAFGVALLTRGTNSGGVGLLERLFWASAYAWVLAASWAIIRATRRRTRPPAFDPALVQRKLLRSSPKAIHSAYEFFSIGDPEGAKRWLSGAIDPSTGVVLADDDPKSRGSVTLAFTCAGLRALGVNYRDNDPFAEGMEARAARLGDVGHSDPDHWQHTWRARHLHLMIWVEAEDETTRDDLLQRVKALDDREALKRIGTEYAASLRNSDRKIVDHSGFRDGISQPWVLLKGATSKDRKREGGGTHDPFGDWRNLAVGEFVLGERDESDDISRVPDPKPIFHHGSFVVVRKLAQDLDGMKDFFATQSARLHIHDLEERLLGRRRDGRLLNEHVGGDELNDFTFAPDADGLVCPLGAHIRRANPRDALGFGMQLSARHRIIRRGNTYSADIHAPDRWKKGLMFIAVNARIDDQFEFIQRLWLNDGDRQRLGASRDLVAGSSRSLSTAIMQDEDRPLVTAPTPVFVRTMGGGYFFAPSMAGLRALADLESAAR